MLPLTAVKHPPTNIGLTQWTDRTKILGRTNKAEAAKGVSRMPQRWSEISLQHQGNGAKRNSTKVEPKVVVENQQPNQEPEKIFCPQCGATMTWWRGSPFCPRCGWREGCCD
ncbi:hypothetical protein [Fervidibacter sacchari]